MGEKNENTKESPFPNRLSPENGEENDGLPERTLVPRPAMDFSVTYRRNDMLTEKEQDRILNAVEKGGVALGTNTYINREVLPTLLNTDRQGAGNVIRNAPREDIKMMGEQVFLSTPEIIKELSKRMEEPRSALQREKLHQARDNVEDFSNNSQLQIERTVESDRIRGERSRIGKKALKGQQASELSGRPLENDGVGHHLYRVADQPGKALDLENLMVLKEDEHVEFHASDYPPTPEGLREYAEENREKWEMELEEYEENGIS